MTFTYISSVSMASCPPLRPHNSMMKVCDLKNFSVLEWDPSLE